MADAGRIEAELALDTSEFTADTKKLESSMSGVLGVAGKLGTAFAGAFALDRLARFTGAIISSSVDINKAMANVASLEPQVNSVEDLKDAVQDLAVSAGKDTGEVADGLYQVISAFGDTAETVAVLETNTRAAAAGLASVEDAVALTSAVTKGYGDTSAAAVAQVSDLAFQTVKLGQTDFPQLAAAMGRVVPIAASVKISQEELFGAMATLTGVTGSAAEVSTQLVAVMKSLLRPNKEMEEALSETATAMGDMSIASGSALLETRGLAGSLDILTKASGGSTDKLAKMLGSSESLTAALALMGGQAETFAEKTDAMADSAGALDSAWTAQTEGINEVGFTMQQVQAKIQVITERLGDGLAPALGAVLDVADPLIDKVADLSRWFADLPQPAQNFAVALGVIVTVGTPLVVMASNLLSALGGLSTVMGTGAAAAGASGGAFGRLSGVLGLTSKASMTAAVEQNTLAAATGKSGAAATATSVAYTRMNASVLASSGGAKAAAANAATATSHFRVLGGAATTTSAAVTGLKTAMLGIAKGVAAIGVVLELVNGVIKLKDSSIDLKGHLEENGGLIQSLGEALGIVDSKFQETTESVDKFGEGSTVVKGDLRGLELIISEITDLEFGGWFEEAKEQIRAAINPIYGMGKALDTFRDSLGFTEEALRRMIGEAQKADTTFERLVDGRLEKGSTGFKAVAEANKTMAQEMADAAMETMGLVDATGQWEGTAARVTKTTERQTRAAEDLEEAQQKLNDAMSALGISDVLAGAQRVVSSYEHLDRTGKLLTLTTNEQEKAFKTYKEAQFLLASQSGKTAEAIEDVNKWMHEQALVGRDVNNVLSNYALISSSLSNPLLALATSQEVAAINASVFMRAIENITPPIDVAAARVQILREAYRTIGEETPEELQKIVDKQAEALRALEEDLGSHHRTTMEARRQYLQSLKNLQVANGEDLTSEQQKALDQLNADLKAGAQESTGIWEDWSKSVSTIITNTAQNIAGKITDAIVGTDRREHNARLEEQEADLLASLEERTEEWEQYQADAETQLRELTEAHADSVAEQELALMESLEDQRRSYEEFREDTLSRIGGLKAAHAEELAEETEEVRRNIAEREEAYVDYAREIEYSIAEVREASRESLAEDLADLRDQLADKSEAFEDFVADAEEKLGRIRIDFADDLEDQQRRTKRRIQDEDKQLKRQEEDIKKRIKRLLKEGKSADSEEIRDLKVKLARKQEDHKTTTDRLKEDLADWTEEHRRKLERQEADLRKNLERRREAHQEFVQENKAAQDDTIAAHKKAEEQKVQDLQNQLRKRKQELDDYTAEQLAGLEESRRRHDEELANEVSDLKARLGEKKREYDEFKDSIPAKLDEIRTKADATLQGQVADLKAKLSEQETAYNDFKNDIINTKIPEIREAHRTMWGDIKDSFDGMLADLTSGFLGWITESLIGKIIPRITKPLTDALGNIFGKILDQIGIPSIPGLPGSGGGQQPPTPTPPTQTPGGSVGQTGLPVLANLADLFLSSFFGASNFVQQRHMEADIARIEVTSRTILALLYNDFFNLGSHQLDHIKGIELRATLTNEWLRRITALLEGVVPPSDPTQSFFVGDEGSLLSPTPLARQIAEVVGGLGGESNVTELVDAIGDVEDEVKLFADDMRTANSSLIVPLLRFMESDTSDMVTALQSIDTAANVSGVHLHPETIEALRESGASLGDRWPAGHEVPSGALPPENQPQVIQLVLPDGRVLADWVVESLESQAVQT